MQQSQHGVPAGENFPIFHMEVTKLVPGYTYIIPLSLGARIKTTDFF